MNNDLTLELNKLESANFEIEDFGGIGIYAAGAADVAEVDAAMGCTSTSSCSTSTCSCCSTSCSSCCSCSCSSSSSS